MNSQIPPSGYLRRDADRHPKIDDVFARGVAGPQGRSLAGAIVELGKAVGLVVVTEGVESAEQVATLRALGRVPGAGRTAGCG